MIEPMLCQTGSAEDFKRLGWVAEVKFDGTRAFLIKSNHNFLIQNRRGVDYTHRLPEITEEAKEIDATYIIDGEICYFNHEGISEFTPCQRRCSIMDIGKIWYLKSKFPLNFMGFDILELQGENLRQLPYERRKGILEEFLATQGWNQTVNYTQHTNDKEKLFEKVVARGGEGVILKRLNSQYEEGTRSYSWLKVKRFVKEVCQVVGYTEGQNRRSNYFGALVLSQDGKYAGKCGSGFSDYELAKIIVQLKKSPRCTPPFQIDEPYIAVETNLKVLVRYHKRTESGVFRFPSFLKMVE